MKSNLKDKLNWKTGINKDDLKTSKKIVIILSYKMQYQKYL